MADTVSEVLWLERGTAPIWLQKKAIYCYYSEFFFLRFSILPAKESASVECQFLLPRIQAIVNLLSSETAIGQCAGRETLTKPTAARE